MHVLDNRKGTKKIRGIYQWVDKELQPARAQLRQAADVRRGGAGAGRRSWSRRSRTPSQPESFQLDQAARPEPQPSRAQRGQLHVVRGAVRRDRLGDAAAEISSRRSRTRSVVEVAKHVKAYGVDRDDGATRPRSSSGPGGLQGGAAVTCSTSTPTISARRRAACWRSSSARRSYHRLMSAENPFLNVSFTMGGETGEIPVDAADLRPASVQLSLRRRARLPAHGQGATPQWQLKTHAAIVSGLPAPARGLRGPAGRGTSPRCARSLALPANYAHDPSVEREELKRAFIFLLLGEHPATWLPTPAPPPHRPSVTLPDPVAVREVGRGGRLLRARVRVGEPDVHLLPVLLGRARSAGRR